MAGHTAQMNTHRMRGGALVVVVFMPVPFAREEREREERKKKKGLREGLRERNDT